MDDIYKENIVDHYKNPRNFGDLEDADVTVRESNASCGDMVEMSARFKIQDSRLKIVDMRFKGIGCAMSVAASSLLVEEAKKLGELDKVKKIDRKRLDELLGVEVGAAREKCVELPLKALGRLVEEIENS